MLPASDETINITKGSHRAPPTPIVSIRFNDAYINTCLLEGTCKDIRPHGITVAFSVTGALSAQRGSA